MIATIIKGIGARFYTYSEIPEDKVLNGKFASLKIALLADDFTTACLSEECQIRSLTPQNFQKVITEWKPDLIFVESAFHGLKGAWRYEIAKCSKLLRTRKPQTIYRLVDFAKDRNIPTIFWNKDDGAFFDTFIDVAKVFDYIFTTDKECIERYRAVVQVPVNTLSMPYQPAFHHFTGFNFTRNEACFLGSYYRRILNDRRLFLDTLFLACEAADLRLNIYDRNHDRLSRYVEFRFPKKSTLCLHGKLPHRETAQMYKTYAVSLNVNSVTDSETMCSRRFLEILACGGIAVTNPSPAISRYFSDYCHVVATHEEALALFSRLKNGPSRNDKDRAEAGAIYVRENHTWAHRLESVCAIANV